VSVSISDIENGIIALLQERWSAAGITERVEEFNVGLDFEDIAGTPAVSLATERIGVERITDGNFKISPIVSLYIVFKNVADPAARRAGIYPLALGSMAILANQKLGLDIDPLQPAGDMVEIFHAALKARGLIGFKLILETSFDIEMVGDGVDLIKLAAIAVHYMRQDPAIDDPDAIDEIEIPQGE
jgi:hypothetical protein